MRRFQTTREPSARGLYLEASMKIAPQTARAPVFSRRIAFCGLLTATSACTLDDGRLSETVQVSPPLPQGGTDRCVVRITNLGGDVVLEGRHARNDTPAVAALTAEQIGNTGHTEAVFGWKGSTSDDDDGTFGPSLRFAEDGALVVDGGCTERIAAGTDCRAEIQAWVPSDCALEVTLGVGEHPVVVGFQSSLTFLAAEASVVELDHDGVAIVTVDAVHDSVVYCGAGDFEFHVGGAVTSCEAWDAVSHLVP